VLLVGFAWAILLAGMGFFAPRSLADTNAAGVEIEIISDEGVSVTGDPVTTFLNDIDSAADTKQIDIWARIKNGYAMPDIDSEYTARHESWYASRPDYVNRMVDRSQKYLFHIVEEVEKRNMPTEIALLPMIESAYNPQAYSRSRASGIWQFIPSTGKNYGLEQNWWVDNRRDVTAATDAALNYLQKLHGMFGTWDLALAAYNAGEGTVQRAIDRNRRAGLPTNYQSLRLPPETRNYVPKLQAIKNIVNNPERFGLTIDSIPNRAYFARVTAPKQIDAKLAAQFAEISLEEFSALNPSYNRPVITSNDETHQFLLPTWAAERFTSNLEGYDKPLTSWQTYSAKRGERMDKIAKKFGIHVSQLRNVNNLSNSKKLRSSQPVLVPAAYSAQSDLGAANLKANEPTTELDESVPSLSSPIIHKVRRGETLHALAEKYDVDVNTLVKINRLKSTKVKAGQVIRLNTQGIETKNNEILAPHKNKKYQTNSRIKNRKSKSHQFETRSHIRLK